jgi:hypothetical protein
LLVADSSLLLRRCNAALTGSTRASSTLVAHSLVTIQKSKVEIRKEEVELNIIVGFLPAISPSVSIRFMIFLLKIRE